MRKLIAFVTAAAVASQLTTPVLANDMFPDTTMLGWRRTSDAAAMAYFKLPFHASKNERRQPRFGLMITTPGPYAAGTVVNHAAMPSLLDLGFSGRDFRNDWTASVTVSDTVAWASDPASLPKDTRNLFEGGTTWVVVGVLSVGIAVGAYALADRKK